MTQIVGLRSADLPEGRFEVADARQFAQQAAIAPHFGARPLEEVGGHFQRSADLMCVELDNVGLSTALWFDDKFEMLHRKLPPEGSLGNIAQAASIRDNICNKRPIVRFSGCRSRA